VAAGMPKNFTIAAPLVAGTPDPGAYHTASVVLQGADHGADVIVADRLAVPAEARVHDMREQRVLGRTVHHVHGHHGAQDPGGDLDGGEVPADQNRTAALGQRTLQMFQPLDRGQPADPRIACSTRSWPSRTVPSRGSGSAARAGSLVRWPTVAAGIVQCCARRCAHRPAAGRRIRCPNPVARRRCAPKGSRSMPRSAPSPSQVSQYRGRKNSSRTCRELSPMPPDPHSISLVYSLLERLRSLRHRFWYGISERVRWSRGVLHETPARELPGVAFEQRQRIAALQGRYQVHFEERMSAATAPRMGSASFWYARRSPGCRC